MRRFSSRLGSAVAAAALLNACTTAPPLKIAQGWQQRLMVLNAQTSWQMQGRVAAAIGAQGWQASLDWRQTGDEAAVRLAGPLGVGAVALRLTPTGVVIDRPGADAASGAGSAGGTNELIRERLGFSPPFDALRYWLLGIPAPGSAAEVERNAQDRAARLTQNGWNVEYTRYVAVGADVLPAQLTLRRDDARVRIVVDRWALAAP